MEGGGDGLRALDKIRRAGNNVPFYIISSDSIRDKALELGANGYYDKFDFAVDSDILDKIKRDFAQYLQ